MYRTNCTTCKRVQKTMWGIGCDPLKVDEAFNWDDIIQWRKDNKGETCRNAIGCPGWVDAHTYE